MPHTHRNAYKPHTDTFIKKWYHLPKIIFEGRMRQIRSLRGFPMEDYPGDPVPMTKDEYTTVNYMAYKKSVHVIRLF